MHSHSHGHGGHSHSVPEAHNKAFAIAVLFNFGFVLVQAYAAIQANSMGLLADAGHNLGDVVGLMLSWAAAILLTKAPSQRYSYGFKRTSILAAIINALLLVATSAIIAYESIHKLISPQPVHSTTMIVIGLLGILINGGTSLLFIRGGKGDLNVKSAFIHLAADALLSLGVVVTGLLIMLTGFMWMDPLIGLAIVVTILMGTWGLLRDSVNLMLDAVPHNVNRVLVRDYLLALPGVKTIHDLHIWGLSTQDNALTAHLVMPDAQLSDEDYHHIKHELHEKFNINHVTLQVEKGQGEHECSHHQSC